ncbi:hypothetical protein [Thermosulfurimonas sp. F29]|uniref:hypothetical protein n=1 Tax=Thermosulfurimonas sp. F29 TaxID=2867247 RepID=UPI001C83B708|nr:hypothetical protein [Thermosulfurimonas sp. F29]MBX6424141.1 hypothetical protein [Thermosulfurimonas sp. F29]
MPVGSKMPLRTLLICCMACLEVTKKYYGIIPLWGGFVPVIYFHLFEHNYESYRKLLSSPDDFIGHLSYIAQVTKDGLFSFRPSPYGQVVFPGPEFEEAVQKLPSAEFTTTVSGTLATLKHLQKIHHNVFYHPEKITRLLLVHWYRYVKPELSINKFVEHFLKYGTASFSRVATGWEPTREEIRELLDLLSKTPYLDLIYAHRRI